MQRRKARISCSRVGSVLLALSIPLVLMCAIFLPSCTPSIDGGGWEIRTEAETQGFEWHQVLVIADEAAGRDDILLINPRHISCVEFRSGRLEKSWQRTLPDSVFFLGICDVLGDERPELLFRYPYGIENESWIQVHPSTEPTSDEYGPQPPLLELGPMTGEDRDGSGGFAEALGIAGSVPARPGDPSAGRRLIVKRAAASDLQPRGLEAYDGMSGRLVWRHHTACPIYSELIGDFDDDGAPEILVGTAPNGYNLEVNGTDDRTCYLIGLDAEGQLIHRAAVGGRRGHVQLATTPFHQAGRTLIAAIHGSPIHEGLPKENRLLTFDWQAGETARIHAPIYYDPESIHLVAPGRGAAPLILVKEKAGEAKLFDIETLDTLHRADIGTYARIAAICDLDVDGESEIVLVRPGSIQMLDASLTPLTEPFPIAARSAFIASVTVLPLPSVENRGRFVVADGAALRVLRAGPSFHVRNEIAIAALAITLLALAGIVLVRRRSARSPAPPQAALKQFLAALEVLRHSRSGGQAFDNFSILARNAIAGDTEHLLGALRNTAIICLDVVLPALGDVADCGRAAGQDGRQIDRLTDDAGRLRAVLHNLASEDGSPAHRLLGEEELETMLSKAEQLIAGIVDTLSDMDAAALSVFSTDVFRASMRVTSAVRGVLHGDGGGHISVDATGSTRACIDRADFNASLEELLMNAARAIDTSPSGEIQIQIHREGDRIHVDIRDNGRGIPVERHKTVFERGESGSGGTGQGLANTREILRRYRGDLVLKGSQPGCGTTFRMILRTEQP